MEAKLGKPLDNYLLMPLLLIPSTMLFCQVTLELTERALGMAPVIVRSSSLRGNVELLKMWHSSLGDICKRCFVHWNAPRRKYSAPEGDLPYRSFRWTSTLRNPFWNVTKNQINWLVWKVSNAKENRCRHRSLHLDIYLLYIICFNSLHRTRAY